MPPRRRRLAGAHVWALQVFADNILVSDIPSRAALARLSARLSRRGYRVVASVIKRRDGRVRIVAQYACPGQSLPGVPDF